MYAPCKPWKILLSALIILLLSTPLTTWAQIPSPRYGTYVNDLAGVLDKDDIASLNEQIHALEEKYSVQLAVVLVNNLPDGMSIEDYARKIGQKWHVGIHDSGLVYIASFKERKQRLEVSSPLSERISDTTAHDITDQVKPFFRDKDYAGGLKSMISDIDDHLQPTPSTPVAPAQTAQDIQPPAINTTPTQVIDTSNENHTFPLFFAVLFIGGIIWILIALIFRGVRSPHGSNRPDSRSNSTVYIPETDYRTSYGTRDNTDIIAAAGAAAIAGSMLETNNDTPTGSNNDTSGSSGNDFGNWGGSDSGPSDPGFSSSDSGFSGGGSTNDW